MPQEDHFIALGESVMRAITHTLLDLGYVTDDARYEDAEDAAFNCVIAIAELDDEFEVTDDFRRRLNEAIHMEQFAETSIRDAETSIRDAEEEEGDG